MPTFDVRPTHYAKAVAVAAGVAILGGVIWWAAEVALFIIFQGQFPGMLTSLVAIPLGYFGGDLISRSVNRKRSNGLDWVAGGTVVVAYFISLQLTGPFFSLSGLLFIGVGVYLAVQRLRR